MLLSLTQAAFGRDYLSMNLTEKSDLKAEDIDRVTAGTGLAGLGKTFIQAEERNGVNAQFLVALAIYESGWGGSRIARDKNNIFGFGTASKISNWKKGGEEDG